MKICNTVIRRTLTVLAGELAFSALTIALYALLGLFDLSVLLGAVAGSVIATLNFFLMVLGAEAAADKAVHQDVKGGQALVSVSYGVRLIGLFVILVICAGSGVFDPVALVIPLVFTRPVLTIAEFRKQKGGHDA